MTPYDPQMDGARCGECFLRDRRDGLPVPAEKNPDAFAIVVGEAPGATEVQEQRPFVGRSGTEATMGLAVHGVRRSHVSWTNSLNCHPPDDNLDLILHKFERENKKREKQGLARLPSPFECCAPRLQKELEGYQNIIALGRTAANAVLGRRASIMDIRGGPVTLDDGRRVMPTIHPAFVLRMRRWTRAFRTDLGRAVRWFRGELSWREPKVNYHPTPDQLAAFLSHERPYAYDTETKSPLPGRPELARDPLLARLGLLGIAVDDEVMVIPFLGVDGVSKWYTSSDEARIVEIVRAWATHQRKLKIDHNGYYDYMILKWNLGIITAPRRDTILLHRDVEPELPHGLGYVASVNTEIPSAWKVDHAGTDAETDQEWRAYNATDCVLTFRQRAPLEEAIVLRGQQKVVEAHHAVQRYCIGLHENGLYVNTPKRAEWDVKLRADAVGHLGALRNGLAALHGEDFARAFNPGSVEQLKELFFVRWGLSPVEFSKKTGEPSTGDDSIRAFLRDPKLKPAQKEWLTRLRRYRNTTKMRGTYVRKLVHFQTPVPPDPLSLDEDDDAQASATLDIDRKSAQKKGPTGYGLVLNDGRVHPHWNAHSVATGWRCSSDGPNAQNWPRKLRNMIAPAPGHVLFYADQDQLELRLVAVLSGAARYLETFRKGGDPHSESATMIFGNVFKQATGKDWDRLRDFAKTFTYAVVYGAEFDTVYETLTSAEDADGNLPFVNYTQRQVRVALDNWLKQNPEIERWWETEPDLYRRQGFLSDALFGYRCDFLDGEERNKLLNFRCQSTGGAIVNAAAIELVDGPNAPIAFGAHGHGTGMINQGHDRLDFEWPFFHERRYVEKNKKGEPTDFGWCEKGCTCPLEKARLALEEAMHRRVPGLDVQFSGKAKVAVSAWC